MTSETTGLECPACSYQLNTITSDRCPECGQRFEIVRPLVTTIGPAPRDWRYWSGMGAWSVGVLIFFFSWMTQDIFWFNTGVGFMLSVITIVVIGKR